MEDAGFELKWAELAIVGSIAKEAAIEALVLTLRSQQGTVLVVPGVDESTRRRYVDVARWAGDGTVLRLAGRAHAHEGGQTAMTVSSFKVVAESRQ